MAKLSSKRAGELADAFHQIAFQLGDYRIKNYKKLTPAQLRTLKEDQWTLLNHAYDFMGKALILEGEEANDAFKKVRAATKRMEKAIDNVKTVKTIITYAGLLIQLAGAIMSKDAGKALEVAGTIIGEIQQDSA